MPMTKATPHIPDIAITPAQWKIVFDILQKHVPNKEIFAFGSRARHTEKPYSDLDLIIVSDSSLPLSQLAAIEHAFSESDLPFKVDIIDSTAITPQFHEQIKTEKIKII